MQCSRFAPMLEPPTQRMLRQARSLDKVAHCAAPSLDVEPSSVWFVLGLFKRGRPATVFLEVPGVVVFPVERQAFRRLPHVIQKSLEPAVAEPRSTNRNASAAISGVRLMLRVEAALLHAAPNGKRSGTAFAVRGRLNSLPSAVQLDRQAATRAGVSIAKAKRPNKRLFAAVAQAAPSGLSIDGAISLHGDKSPEPPSRQVNWCAAHRGRLYDQLKLQGLQEWVREQGKVK